MQKKKNGRKSEPKSLSTFIVFPLYASPPRRGPQNPEQQQQQRHDDRLFLFFIPYGLSCREQEGELSFGLDVLLLLDVDIIGIWPRLALDASSSSSCSSPSPAPFAAAAALSDPAARRRASSVADAASDSHDRGVLFVLLFEPAQCTFVVNDSGGGDEDAATFVVVVVVVVIFFCCLGHRLRFSL